MTTYLVTRATERERQGLPPETPEQIQTVIERAATREFELQVQRWDMDPEYSDEELLALWAATPRGRALSPFAGFSSASRPRSTWKVRTAASREAR